MLMGKVFTVTEINRIVKNLLESQRDFANIQVQGELSNFRCYPSGHCYFNLKDKQGVLKAVMFAGNAARLKFIPKNGDSVLAVGRVGVYERDGVYQIYVDIMLPLGAGNLMLAYEALKNKLSAEGLFDEARKKSLPSHPATVGIITSSAGAAVRDIITVSQRRNPGIKLILYPVRVQGKEAIAEIVEAIEFMNKENLADVLIVGRGGGSIEDLWAFNEEKVVRAIAASRLPIVSAVGHEQKIDKPGTQIAIDSTIRILGNKLPYVSRGGLKLEKALKVFPLSLQGKIVADLGASTGGFTDCALQNGATKVYAVDVGYGQLAWSLRNDRRVINMERTNVRFMEADTLADKIDVATIDVAFISLDKILPAAKKLLAEDGAVLALVKPQFEAGKENVGKKGVVRDAKIHGNILPL